MLSGETALGLSAGAVGGAQGVRSLEVAWDAARLPEGWSARLVDTATNESRSLAEAGTYAFETAAGVAREAEAVPVAMLARGGTPRFRVVLSPNAVAVEEGAAAGLALSVSPNPVAVGGVVRVSLPEASVVRVVVYDVLGRQVAVLADEERGVGEHALALGAERLAPGVYVVRVTAGEASVVRRVTVAR